MQVNNEILEYTVINIMDINLPFWHLPTFSW